MTVVAAPELEPAVLIRPVATITHVSFPAGGGVFVVRLTALPRGGLCSFSAGRGVTHYDASFACGGRLFAHAGRVLPNRAPVTRRWTVRASVNAGAVTRRFAWVISVADRALAPPSAPAGPPGSAPPPTCAPLGGNGPSTSANWAGYVLALPGGCATSAGATWQVPTLDCPPPGSAPVGDADWVGVDGTTSATFLFQTGVASQCINGVQVSHTWFEDIQSDPPAPEVSLFPVSAGDTVTASVAQVSPGQWRSTITDTSTGESASQVLGYGGPGASAEWIEEDPSQMNAAGSVSLVPLADFGTVSFTGLSLNGSPPVLSAADAVSIARSGTVLASPGPPSADGFSVTYG